jgi:hypothetical protein
MDFVHKFGVEIHRKGLYKNFILHVNNLAEFGLLSAFEVFDIIVRIQGPMLQNFFPPLLTMRSNKLERLSLETLSSQVLEYEGKARVNPIGGPFRCFLLGQAGVLHYTGK